MNITMHEVGLFSWGFTAGMLYVWGGNKIVDKLIERQTARIDAEAEAERLAGAGVNEILARSLRGDADAQMDCAKLMRAGWPGLAEVHKRTSKGILGRLREMVLDGFPVVGIPLLKGGHFIEMHLLKFRHFREMGALKLRLFLLQRRASRLGNLPEVGLSAEPEFPVSHPTGQDAPDGKGDRSDDIHN